MTQSFDDFKKYHNANYHDGSSHFDEQIYKKSNGDDFDCSFVQDCYDHFEAGQQSRQSEIDKLEMEIIETQEFLNNQNCIKQAEIDELQKRIDEALRFANDAHSDLNIGMLKMVEILRGKQDEMV